MTSSSSSTVSPVGGQSLAGLDTVEDEEMLAVVSEEGRRTPAGAFAEAQEKPRAVLWVDAVDSARRTKPPAVQNAAAVVKHFLLAEPGHPASQLAEKGCLLQRVARRLAIGPALF